MIEHLGGFIVDKPQFGNVLICDRISRTFKFLYCLAKGLPIVTPNWLSKSSECGQFQPTDSYLIKDKNAETRFSFNLKKSLGSYKFMIQLFQSFLIYMNFHFMLDPCWDAETAQKSRLFTNYHIFATPNAQPATEEICEIVECSGGKYGDSALIKCKSDAKAVLITHKKDKKLWPDYRRAHPDIQIVSSEGFMQSVVQQKINFSQYQLTE